MVNLRQAGQWPWLWNCILTLSTSLSAFFVSSEKRLIKESWAGAMASAFCLPTCAILYSDYRIENEYLWNTFVTREQLESPDPRISLPLFSSLMMKQEFVKRLVPSIELLLGMKGFKEYFAIKATRTIDPKILQEGCGVDTASYELLMADKLGFRWKKRIMFSSNNTPADEFVYR